MSVVKRDRYHYFVRNMPDYYCHKITNSPNHKKKKIILARNYPNLIPIEPTRFERKALQYTSSPDAFKSTMGESHSRHPTMFPVRLSRNVSKTPNDFSDVKLRI